MNKIGLVIQGPLVSYGKKSGMTAHVAWIRIPDEQTVRYDCRENIRSMIEDFGHLFEHVVISTWKSEVEPGDSWDGATLIASDDGGLPVRTKGRARVDNSLRQMFGTLVGIEYLEANSNVDMIVKIRTDQYVDLSQMLVLIDHYRSLSQYTKEVIFIPSIMGGDARYAIMDFYFAGSLSAMKAFHRSLFECAAFEFERSIHHELWLKYAYVAYRDILGASEYAYFPASYRKAYCEETFQIFQFMVRRVFWPLSFDCFQTIVWRGRPFSKEALEFVRRNYIFQKTTSENSIEEICNLPSGECPRFLGIDWQRYANFRRSVLKKPFSSKEKIFLCCNMGAQLAFRFLERTGYFVAHPAAFFAGAKRRYLRFVQASK